MALKEVTFMHFIQFKILWFLEYNSKFIVVSSRAHHSQLHQKWGIIKGVDTSQNLQDDKQ